MLPTDRPPALDRLKGRARDLLRAYRAADPDALRRVAAQLPRFARPPVAAPPARLFRLADALCVVAREAGYASWPRLKAALDTPQAQTRPQGPATTAAPEDDGARVPRDRRVEDLAVTLAELATQGDSRGLVTRMIVPRRDILAVRALLVTAGAYPAVVETLLAGLESPSAPVRHDCAHALDHFATDQCLPALRRLLDDPVPRVRRVALHVLSCDACKLAPLRPEDDLLPLVIDRALTDPSINVRRHATSALGGFCADVRAMATLRGLAATATDAAVRREARWALRRMPAAYPQS